jgi:hypothetical protein
VDTTCASVFPKLGNGIGEFSEHWKKSATSFPGLGKFRGTISKAWKNKTGAGAGVA